MNRLTAYVSSQVGKKQIVAISGLCLILFLVAHLLGNLFLFKGPEAFNGYVAKLKSFGLFLRFAEAGLAFIFIIHIILTIQLVIENKRARGKAYQQVNYQGKRSLATRIMPLTGLLLLAFVVVHLFDFTFIDHHGPESIVNGSSLGLYGVVWNTYKANFCRVVFYVMAMCAVGFHLGHAIQSVVQTFGFYHQTFTPVIKIVSILIGLVFALGFSALPIYIYLQ
ncbi:MAG: succinate dehydrogenase cytochrome b subunit [Lentisphaeria bacterium]|nr:succinate dehydrogenase cytochrome b subunit [Lentisphaeria bacterium]